MNKLQIKFIYEEYCRNCKHKYPGWYYCKNKQVQTGVNSVMIDSKTLAVPLIYAIEICQGNFVGIKK